MAPKGGGDSAKVNSAVYKDKSKPTDIRLSNINAAKAVSDAIRTSLGPRGMDKMIQAANGEVTITNDGATILKQMSVIHPAAKMLVELSRAQDIEAGDGTTSVVVIAGALLDAAEKLLQKGIHPTVISDGFQKALQMALQVVEGMAIPVDLQNEDALLQAAATSLNSKVVSQHSTILAPIAVQAIRAVMEPIVGGVGARVDLRDVKVLERLGGTVEDTELVRGLVVPHRAANVSGPHRIEKAKVGLIQFCISPPKTDMDHNVIVSDYAAMDRVLKEERQYILNIVKQIKKAGCNVLLVQKSILRDALSDLAVHFLDKIKCMVIKDIEREDVEFVCKTLGCRPVASLDHFTAENLVNVDLVEEVNEPSGKYVKMTGCASGGRTVSVLVRGSSGAVVAEAARSLHDALCAVRCVARRPALLPGGGAPEAAAAAALARAAIAAPGADHYCLRAYADALEVVPSTLAENAGNLPLSRGSAGAVVAEAARSLHDALCAVRCVARRPALLPGGGAPEAAAAAALARAAIAAPGADHYCLRAYADALEVVPSTLAENAGNLPLSRGSAGAVVAEAARSLHDALCAVRCVARRPALLPGGGAPEAAAAAALARAAIAAPGADHYCLRAYADALEVVPSTLAENAGNLPLSRGSAGAVVAEAARSLHDALCAVRCVARRPALLPGGGAPEAAAAAALARAAIAAPGADHYCLRAYADALEVVPSTLAENAGNLPLSRGSAGAVVAEAARSLHDALCAVRCVARRPALLPGGGAPEAAAAAALARAAIAAPGADHYCLRAYADALEVVPSTLAENAGNLPLSRGSAGAVVAEAARSLHDALCAVRCVARRPALLPGGGAPEAAAAAALARAAIAAPGADHYCLRAYADALEVVPSTLAENAGLNPIETVTELRAAHAAGASGASGAGVNVRRGRVTDMRQEHVLQPLHVTASALALATETVRAILKIDDIVNTMN